jgi:RNA polymerase sigma-54 factor
MKQSLQLRLGQQLTMTPQLQQAIRLLQLSSLELQTEIQATLESNPMLETDEETTAEEAGPPEEEQAQITAQPPDESPAGTPVDGATSQAVAEDFSSAWGTAGYGVASDEDDRDPFETRGSAGQSLRDHLLEQLHLSSVSDTDRLIAMAIVESVRDDGYLEDSLDGIAAGLERNGVAAALDDIEAMLHLVQRFDPPGIAARDPRECMIRQLEAMPEDTPGRANARRIIDEAIEQLAAHDVNALRRQLGLSREALREAIELIHSLDPHPGSQIANTTPQYIVPDVFVRKERGVWRVRLNPDVAPRLRINPLYSGMVKRADRSEDNTFLRDNLQEARWFIKSLQSRNETLLKVATAIVEHQRAFLDYGEEAMKPLVLRDIADELEMHESTISRVTTEKYMHTPRGIFEFKYFFSSHVATTEGGECSATAIRAMVKKLIDQEDRAKPLSDHKIAGILVERGIHVARRTVAKYRESMAIPPSSERKRLI